MKEIFKSNKVYIESIEAFEQITIYELTQDEINDTYTMYNHEIAEYFGIDLRQYAAYPGEQYTRRYIESNGAFLVIKERTAYNV